MAEDDDAAKRIGSVVDGRYKITELMASGSMGSVYKGERIPVGKLVAIKFLHASYANDSEFQARFERETRVASKLAHPNCVGMLDFGVWENAPYLVMEYVAGTTLRERMDKGPIPSAQALSFARQIAAGLAHAHEQDVIHRDIKPANLMITDEIGTGERVRILDFGLARLRGNVGRDATQSNMVVGTPNYMAPEQTVGGAIIDARTDIYAVGVVLFEMVIGERPFHAEDTLQLLGMHRAAPIPRLADRAKEGTDIPPGLQEVIDKAMAKVPRDRYQTAIALQQAIDDVISGNVAVPEHQDETLPRTGPVVVAANKAKTANTAAVAPTMLDVDTGDIEEVPRRGFFKTMLVAMVLVGGTAAIAGYMIHRSGGGPTEQTPKVVTADKDAGSATPSPVATADATETAAVVPTPATDGAPEVPADAAAPADAGVDALLDDAGLPIIGTPDDVEMDPEKAVDLDPAAGKGSAVEDEAADAPKTSEEVEKKPQPDRLATTLHDAVELVQQGKRELALASLRALRKKNPKSAYIPFLLGNLYYDQRWWSVAMDDYGDAIRKNPQYKSNPTLNRNVIRMLGSGKTQAKAATFLRSIGHPAHVFLEYASKHEENPLVRKKAGELARYIR
jgi:serine/threonine-protein kinase